MSSEERCVMCGAIIPEGAQVCLRCRFAEHQKREQKRKTETVQGYIMPVCELLAGLAEECGELTQAALKLRRVWDGTNPTPTTEEAAMEDLYEEIADVFLYIEELKLNRGTIGRIMGEKRDRWKKRLEGKA